jgi:hypothetical protein
MDNRRCRLTSVCYYAFKEIPMTIWFREHLFALKSAFTHLRAGTGNFIFNVLVVAIALALPIAGLTLIENIRPISSQLSIEPEISIFLTTDTARENATALSVPIKRLLKESNISGKLSFTPKEKALAAMQDASSLAEVLSTLAAIPCRMLTCFRCRIMMQQNSINWSNNCRPCPMLRWFRLTQPGSSDWRHLCRYCR